MKLSDRPGILIGYRRLAALAVGCLLCCSSAAGHDWREDGLEALRPNYSDASVAFLPQQQLGTPPADSLPVQPMPADPDPDATPIDQAQPLAENPLTQSYGEWLEASGYKRIPRVREGRLVLPSLEAPTIATDQIGNGRLPEGIRYDKPAPVRPLPETSAYRGTTSWTPAYWAAANTFSNPRYFEDRMLERHGHEICPAMTPVLSGVRFFTQIGMLPYLMTVTPPCECESTLGYFRSGTCAPGLKQRPPFQYDAVLVEAAAAAGFVLLIP